MKHVIAPHAHVAEHLMDWRTPGQFYRTYIIRHGGREVQISISPTGRSTQVFVDGVKIPAA